MAHMLEMTDTGAAMAYAETGGLPWHGLGVPVRDDMSPVEMMEAAKLDWSVEKKDVFFKDKSGKYRKAGNKQALVRSSDGRYMDIVSDDWIPVQNAEAFEFFHKYVETGGMSMNTAGSLKDGQVIWGLAKVNESFSLFGGKDKVESYLLLSNPHNYGRGVDIRFTPIRVVCNNTLTMALGEKATLGISLNHRAAFDAEKVQIALAEAHEKLGTYHDMAKYLSEKRYTEASVFEYFSRVFPKTSTGKAKGNVISFADMMARIKSGEKTKDVSRNAILAMETLETQPGAEYGAGTWWGAVNAVTYMTNHVLGHSADTRLQSAWFGVNKDRAVHAMGLALEYAEAA